MTTLGCGNIRFWGFSPAVDLLESASEAGVDVAASDLSDPLRCLLVCPGDIRHVLKTLGAAHVRREERRVPRALEVSVYEREPEVLARHALLLAVAVDFELPRRERAELLLELWANARLREKTAAYLAAKARELARVVTAEEGPLSPLFDLSAIKMKERDALEEVFRSWAEDIEFDVVRLRDERLRGFYKARYESRVNVLDWDYQMELAPLASIVHKLHFREWRMSGILFEVRDSTYVAPNRSLASMAAGRERGRSVLRRGFWCDVSNGPFAATGGTECDEPRLTAKRSDQHFKSSNDISYYNVLGWLTQLESGKQFALKQASATPDRIPEATAPPATSLRANRLCRPRPYPASPSLPSLPVLTQPPRPYPASPSFTQPPRLYPADPLPIPRPHHSPPPPPKPLHPLPPPPPSPPLPTQTHPNPLQCPPPPHTGGYPGF